MPEQDAATPQSAGAFERLAGKAKQTVGRLLGRGDLAEEGALQEAKGEAASRAARSAADADQRQREAEVAGEVDANRLEQERVDAQLTADRRAAEIERENEAGQAAADQEFARREAQVRIEAHHEAETIERRERMADATRLEGALDADALAERGDRAEATAAALEDAQHELEHNQTGEQTR